MNSFINKYLFIDTESGGVDPVVHSLLSVAMVVCRDEQIISKVEFFIQQDPYVVTASGLNVNKIDLVAHHERALEPLKAWEAIQSFLAPYFAPNERIILVGHNIAFDRAFLSTFFKSIGKSFESRFSHRSIDTHSIAAALQDAGRIPATVSLSSNGLFEHFKIEVPPEKRHTALGDALATFELYWHLVDLAR